jgi:serpin B
MKQKGKFNYYPSEELRAHVVEFPYVGDDISMMVILPPFDDQESILRSSISAELFSDKFLSCSLTEKIYIQKVQIKKLTATGTNF